jgi:hypothetical protein
MSATRPGVLLKNDGFRIGDRITLHQNGKQPTVTIAGSRTPTMPGPWWPTGRSMPPSTRRRPPATGRAGLLGGREGRPGRAPAGPAGTGVRVIAVLGALLPARSVARLSIA